MLTKPFLPVALSAIAAALTIIASILGLRDPGLYRHLTPERLIPGAISQDLVSLGVAVGLLALAARLAAGASARFWAVWLGLLGYLVYGYGLYAFETIINPLFLFYIAIFSASLWALLAFFARADRGKLAAKAPPRRLTAALFTLLIALFAALWLSILIPAMQTRTAPDAATIFVFDFGFVLPALAFAAAMLWRADPWGDLLALPLLIKSGTLGISVLIGSLLAPMFGLPINPGEVATYAILGLLPLALTIPWWRALTP
ncbi:hypothetical protein [Sinisalibacter lacisalsi]|uniref:Uncharacterized protein n=1 Tax=Sinisalibacter lacisalsi TaxID=1526570 RepID=A0ABQ1QNS5_9RHOB|nr:hypothetical protein [Sinisalibacter lacisalsi]GGD33987.1 hypothetical protein GCM10011358_17540 [Sinisalibacter lacisalsi]